ncbi:MAG: chloride channel protein [Clostridia bacterium]|nr:chloride channel protein [Clostridia bacterium]
MKKQYCSNVISLVLPAVFFGAVTGILTGGLVVLYKFCAKYVIEFSEHGYHFLRSNPIWILAVLAALFGLAYFFSYIYRKFPNLRGGGIPVAIGNLRGIFPMKGLQDLFGIFTMSLTSFFLGLPLGNEGPAVQMGTAVGRSSVHLLTRKNYAWDRYAMTGGACAGFSVATGATISGLLFAVEEAHRRISPVLLIVASSAVTFSELINQFLSPLLGVDLKLFPSLDLKVIAAKELWLPLLIGILVGLFSVAFLKYYRVIKQFFNKTIEKIPYGFKIFLIFAATLGLGLYSYDFISTGHHLIISLFQNDAQIWMLLLLLLLRSTLTIGANSNRLTGDTVLPILVLGALLTASLGKCLVDFAGMDEAYYTVIVVLGITACMAGMMKMPLTAVVFSVEALSCHANIFSVILVAAVAFIITEIFSVHSINDSDLENHIKEWHAGKREVEIDRFVTVQAGSFAIGKQIRDVLWPNKLTVLSFQHAKLNGIKSRADGGKEMRAGDILHIHCTTFDEERSMQELYDIIGKP